MEKSQIQVLIANNVRQLVSEANQRGIKKEHIISIIERNGEYILIYQL